jgi:hypothetical protein
VTITPIEAIIHQKKRLIFPLVFSLRGELTLIGREGRTPESDCTEVFLRECLHGLRWSELVENVSDE